MSIFDKIQVTTETDHGTNLTLVNCELRLRLSTFVDEGQPHLEEAVRLCKKRFINSLEHELYGEIRRKLRDAEVQILCKLEWTASEDVRTLLREIRELCSVADATSEITPR